MKKISKADAIRSIAEKEGFNHSNNWIKSRVFIDYKLEVSVQQVASVLGRYKDRRFVRSETAHDQCKKFLACCNSDINLAKKILVGYGGV